MVKAGMLLNLVTIFLLICGCASVNSDWQKACKSDTIEAYQEFIKKHSDSDYKTEVYLRLRAFVKEQLRRPKNVRVEMAGHFIYAKSIDKRRVLNTLNTPGGLVPITGIVYSHEYLLVETQPNVNDFLKKQIRQLVESALKQHGYNVSETSKITILVLYRDESGSVRWRNRELLVGISKRYKLKVIIIPDGQRGEPVLGIGNDYAEEIFEQKTTDRCFSFDALKKSISEKLSKKSPLEMDENGKLFLIRETRDGRQIVMEVDRKGIVSVFFEIHFSR